MKLTKIKLKNYRSFGENEEVINISNLTSFIGNNSSGKTAALAALNTIFSENPRDRILVRSDFHLPKDESPDEIEEQYLFIEAVFQFDELQNQEDKATYSVPTFFESFVVDSPGGIPYLRVRLEATWQKNSTIEGSIESRTFFITCPESEDIEDYKHTASRHELNKIRMIYVPAVRDTSNQLRNVSGSMMYQIMSSINWKEATKSNVKKIISDLNEEFIKENGVSILKNTIHDEWKEYHTDVRYSNAELRFNATTLDSAIKTTEILFSPAVTIREHTIDEMGDGLKSLFYISMVDSMLDIENQIQAEIKAGKEGAELSFNRTPPILTIIAIEEPENHIAPHLQGRLIERLERISAKGNSQTILTSHSPAVVKRINPEDLRYFRLVPQTLSTSVRSLTLPDENEENQYKYVKEAVKAYPELYFAKLVVLGEGDSEELLLHRFFQSAGNSVDISGISIVPLGGRHVNHFWRLLHDLHIPHVTLLDLDRERHGGGWGRIKYVLNQLIKSGIPEKRFLEIENGELVNLETMDDWDVSNVEEMDTWIDFLEDYNVFFSSPLDIDFLMLEDFTVEYIEALSEKEGPRIRIAKEDDEKNVRMQDLDDQGLSSTEYNERVLCDIRSTLKECGGTGETYDENQRKLMIWYTYFFLNRGKPSTHIAMLSRMDNSTLSARIPNVIKRLMDCTQKLLSQSQEDNYE